MTPIYLDHNATTPIHPEVAAAMDECARAGWGNPASQHFAGREARRRLEAARLAIATLLGARTRGRDVDQVIFTSGGTEANNLAIWGIAARNEGSASQDRRGVVISAIEHPSLVAAAQRAAASGEPLTILPARSDGVVDPDPWIESSAAAPRPRLVSLMLGNNETGVLQPVSRIVAHCRPRGILTHTDAVQCVGKVPVSFANLDVDAMTVTAHKLHGPIGIGALVVRHGVPVDPLLVGGFQQSGVRPGTESLPLVVGLHRALELWQAEGEQRMRALQEVRDHFERRLRALVPGLVVNGESAERLPHTANLAFPGLDRQALLMAFDLARIACSTGSACASGSSEPSPVLRAMGLSAEIVESSIRFSFSRFQTVADAELAACRISSIVKDLRERRKSVPGAATPPKPSVSAV